LTLFWAVILFGILIFFHELGHFMASKLVGVKVLKFSLGFGPRILGKRIGETEYIISAFPLGGYVKPLGEEPGEELSEDERPRAFNSQPVWKRAIIVFSGPFFNFLLAYLLFVIFLGLRLPVNIPDLSSISTTIESVLEDSPAMEAGLRNDDTIVEINGKPVRDWNEMAEYFANNPGKELSIRVKRGERLIDMKITPRPTEVETEDGKKVIVGRIGITKKLNVHTVESSSIAQAPFKAIEAVYRWSTLTLRVVVRILTGSLSARQIGGPILIVDAAAKAAAVGLFAYFNFIAVISINLAILNLFPVPVLDGGHLMLLSIEALRRRPLSERMLNVANRVGMALLAMLITFVFYNDIMRIVVPWLQNTFFPD